MPCAVGDGRAADERGALVDSLGEPLRRDRAVLLGCDVHDLGAAELLRVRDLPDGRELVLADHDLRASLEVERGHDPAHALRDRRGHGELRRFGTQ
jgi:hypothetical protein